MGSTQVSDAVGWLLPVLLVSVDSVTTAYDIIHIHADVREACLRDARRVFIKGCDALTPILAVLPNRIPEN